MSTELQRLTERNKYLLGEIESMRADPWRIPEEAIPRGWEIENLGCLRAEGPARRWFCVFRDGYRDTHSGYGSSPRAAVLNAISSRAKA